MGECSWKSEIIFLFLGAAIGFSVTASIEHWVEPAKQAKIHQHKIIEHRLSELYAPLITATGKGEFSMMSCLVFYEVQDIMDNYSYLADSELVHKYIEVLKLIEFVSIE